MSSEEDVFSIDANTSVLLIIDMQNDFLAQNGYFGQRNMDVKRLQCALDPTRKLYKTLSGKVRVIFTTHTFESDGSDDLQSFHYITPSRLLRSGGGSPVIRGTWGAEVFSTIQPQLNDLIIHKRRFDAFYQTDLELLLRCWKIKTIIFTGVVADVCVESTLRSAYVRDFDVILAKECVAAWTDERMESTISAVDSNFGVSWTNKQIIDALH